MAYKQGDVVKRGDDTKYRQLMADAETNGVDPDTLQALQYRHPNVDSAELAAHLVEAKYQLGQRYGEDHNPAT
jgi:hypothetical protein